MQAVKQKRSDFESQALVHMDTLFGAAYRLTRNPRDAEDLVQDALLRAYRATNRRCPHAANYQTSTP